MKKKLLLLIFTQFVFSQEPTIQWQKCIGGSGSDIVQSISQTSDGGYIVAGYSSSTDGSVVGNHGSNDVLIIKLNSAGTIEWNKVLGGSSYDRVNKIMQTFDGGYVFSGFTYSNNGNVSGNHGSSDVWIVKLNSIGDLIWQKAFGGSSDDQGNDIIEVSDGYVVAAQTFSNSGNVTGNHGTTDAWLLKIDISGNLNWQKCFGGANFDNAVSIQSTLDGGFVFTGSTNSNSGDVSGNHGTTRDYWIVKTTNTGVIQWQKCFGGTANDESSSIQQANDGGFLVSGYTSSNDGNVSGFNGSKDFWYVKLDENGSFVWERSIGGSQEDYAFKVKKTNDDGFIITGYTGSSDGSILFNHAGTIPTLDILVLKINSNGDQIWQKSLGNDGYQDSHDIQQTSDGGFIVAGNSGGGNTLGDVTGYLGGNTDFWVVKLSSDNLINQTFDKNEIAIFPNPVEDILSFNNLENSIKNVSIIDGQGRKMNFNVFNNKIDISNLDSGIYFLEFNTLQNGIFRKKVIKK